MTVSQWFADVAPTASRAPLEGPREADVCVVGGGLTGLWTAYELCRSDPSLDVVVLEREHVGFGASGRSGGWLSGEVAGYPGAHELRRMLESAVDEVGRVTAAEGIACDYDKCGSLEVAQTPAQLQRLHGRVAAERAAGAGEDVELLDAPATRARIAVDGALGARWSPHTARVHPAKLVVGLAEAAERAGAAIHERTAATALGPHRVATVRGEVRARWIVRATEAYTVELPGMRRSVLPVNSAMLATAPLDDATWSAIGWRRGELLVDGAHMYVYLQRTADGRLAIGGRGAPYRYGSRTGRAGAVPRRTVDALRARLERLFPALADVQVDSAWHGVLGVARDWAPRVGADAESGTAWALGYGGEGLAAANLAGRTLRDVILERPSALTRLPWVGRPPRRWEPEPLRFAGIHAVYGLLRAADAVEERTGRPTFLAAAANRLAGRR